VVRIDAANALVKDQVTLVHDGATSFVVAPAVSTSEKSGGCHLHLGTSTFGLNKSVKVAANEENLLHRGQRLQGIRGDVQGGCRPVQGN
jgi:hypothetical protein